MKNFKEYKLNEASNNMYALYFSGRDRTFSWDNAELIVKASKRSEALDKGVKLGVIDPDDIDEYDGYLITPKELNRMKKLINNIK